MSIATYAGQEDCRSLAAQDAEVSGRLPLTRAIPKVRAETGCTAKDARAALRETHDGEWHHTGLRAMRTDYFSVQAAIDLIAPPTPESQNKKERARLEYAVTLCERVIGFHAPHKINVTRTAKGIAIIHEGTCEAEDFPRESPYDLVHYPVGMILRNCYSETFILLPRATLFSLKMFANESNKAYEIRTGHQAPSHRRNQIIRQQNEDLCAERADEIADQINAARLEISEMHARKAQYDLELARTALADFNFPDYAI